MTTSRKTFVTAFAAGALFAVSLAAGAQERRKVERIRAVPSATAASFSTEVPIVQRTSPANGGQTGTLVLNAAHSFNVTLVATNQHGGNVQGNGVALPQTDTFGYFSLPSITNNPSNPEVFIKILDGRPVNGSQARVDVANGTATSDQPVTGQGPFGHVTAEGFTMLDRGAVIHFTGKTNLVLLPRPKDAE